MPHLLLIPRNDDNLAEYNHFASVPEIMPLNTTGIKTHRDDVVFDFTEHALTEKLKALLNPDESLDSVRYQFFGENKAGNLAGDNESWSLERTRNVLKEKDIKQLIKLALYRPFDTRYLAYSEHLIDRPRKEIMGHMVDVESNLGLIACRQAVIDESFSHIGITNAIVDNRTIYSNKGIPSVFPLWLANPPSVPKLNISPKLLEKLASNLGVVSLADHHHMPEGVSADDVIAYIYAVLHAPSYRSRYAQYLKSDFPRIPLGAIEGKASFAAVWKAIVPLGQALIDLHLLRKVPANLQANFPIQSSSEDSGMVVKPRYTEPKGLAKGRVWINAEQYFDGVPPETWNFKVGGYQVCEKWLKDRKGRKLTLDDVEHYNKVVASLTQTRELMTQIDAVANGALWPKSE